MHKDVPRYGSTDAIQYKMANSSTNILARLKQTGVISSLGKHHKQVAYVHTSPAGEIHELKQGKVFSWRMR